MKMSHARDRSSHRKTEHEFCKRLQNARGEAEDRAGVGERRTMRVLPGALGEAMRGGGGRRTGGGE